MSETIAITVNGRRVSVEQGTTVAAAILNGASPAFRESPHGDVRAPLCGMGICFECRVTIDGAPHRRACMTVAQDGMMVVTAGGE